MLTGKTLAMAHVPGHTKTVHAIELGRTPGSIVTLCNGRTTPGTVEPDGTPPTCRLCLKRIASGVVAPARCHRAKHHRVGAICAVCHDDGTVQS